MPGPAEILFRDKEAAASRTADRLFVWLMLLQWAAAVAIALTLAPSAGERTMLFGRAVLCGGAIGALPIFAVIVSPGHGNTRFLVALAQAAWALLLADLAHPRIEAYAHTLVSLAFLAFYRDWRVILALLAASLAGSMLRGDLLSWHSLWVVVCGALLAEGAVRARGELREMAAREASLQQLSQTIEEQVLAKTAELEASRERYKALVEGSHAVPWELDPANFRFTYLSPQFAALTGIDPSAPDASERLWQTVHGADRARVQRSLGELASALDPGTLDFEYRMTGSGGEAIHVHSRVSRGVSGLLLGTSFDVTRNKRLELDLRQAQKLESVGRLAAGVAHEINTPVQFVSDSVHFVRDAVPELVALIARYEQLAVALRSGAPTLALVGEIERAREDSDLDYLTKHLPSALDRALDGLSRVASIVRSMGAFARSDRIEMAPTDLNRAIEDTLVIARNEYKYVADVHLDLQPLPLVTCHGGDINQVLLNLVINAAHAVAAKGERGRIDICTRQEGDDVVIAVSDTGTGIAPDVRDRIFDPFFTTKPPGLGTGQGLAIARAVVTSRHKGQLGFTTRTGAGSTFEVRLPVGPPTSPVSP